MPLSTNAPFNEFGQSMILRDIEQLWLAQSGGNGSGLPGDGATQDKTLEMSQENGDGSGGLDLSKYATLDDLRRATGAPAPSVTTGYLYASGTISLGTNFNTVDASYSSSSGSMTGALSGKTFTAPFSGIYTICSRISVTFNRSAAVVASNIFSTTITPPYGTTADIRQVPFLNFTATGIAWTSVSMSLTPNAKWTGYLAAGQTTVFTHGGNGTASSDISGGTIFNALLISAVG